MDPASAIGVASSAIAFLEFGAKLISATKAIYDSKDGILPEHTAIEQHYKDLLASSSNLDTKANGRALSAEDIYFQKLSSNFRHDCQAIIDLLNAHRCNEGKRRRRILGSVKAAFKLPGVKEQLRYIEERLDKTQKTMQLHVFQQLRQEISGVHVTVVAIQGHGNTMAMRPRDMTAADNEKDPSSLSIHDLKALMDQLSGMVGTLEHLRVESVLASLNYETREVRHDTIKKAHVKTFEWALDSNFPLSKWLQSGDGIFWVSGKPGSGKSTLMKFLADHTQTKSFLKQWAGENELVVASHYFWCSGTLMQKSWDGLLRSLIFDIFRSYPFSIQQACPERWARAGAPGAASTPWTITELANALRTVATLQCGSSLRFCFFIDGLDEYDGDHLELCEIFTDLVRAGTIKMCLSSRPWPVFEDGLGKDLSRKLYVQDLTYDDIRTYVAEQLECHPNWKTNNLTEKERKDMIKEIARKADGVFLWTYLVTRSLREGLSNCDTAIDLKKRLDQLPGDLEKLFRQMLESVNPVYQSKMACFLQATFADVSIEMCPDAGIYSHLEKELDEPGYALHCSLVQISKPSMTCDVYDEFLHNDDEHVSTELRTHILKRYEQMRHIINSRTKGILEVQFYPQLMTPTVYFFHRTIRDFLRKKEIEEFVASKLSNDFNIHLWLMKGHLIRRKKYPVDSYCGDDGLIVLHSWLAHEISHMLVHAANALATVERKHFKAVFTVLDEYDRALHHLGLQAMPSEPSNTMLLISEGGWRVYTNPVYYFREMVILRACRSVLGEYLEAKFTENPGYLEGLGTSPLYLSILALFREPFPRGGDLTESSKRPCHSVLELLLRFGAHPNEPLNDQPARSYGLSLVTMQFKISPWVFLMRTCIRLYGVPVCNCTGESDRQWFHKVLGYFALERFWVVGLYLIHGADPNAEFWGPEQTPFLECSKNCEAMRNMCPMFEQLNSRGTPTDSSRKQYLDHPMFGKPPLWSISCFFAYIWCPFQCVFPCNICDDYLTALDVFLSKHPSLDASNHISDVITSLELDSLGWIVLNGELSKAPFVQFCAHICHQDTWPERPGNHNSKKAFWYTTKFRYAIILRLIDYCGTLDADGKFLKLLEFGISKAEPCPRNYKRAMLGHIEKTRSRRGNGSGSQGGSMDAGDGNEEVYSWQKTPRWLWGPSAPEDKASSSL